MFILYFMKHVRQIVFIVGALLLTVGALAQNISVKSFQPLPMDMTATSLEGKRLDQNGKAAALLKVVTAETGFTFEGGKLGVVDTQQQIGEIWVWVPYGMRKITIRHPKYGALENYYMPFDIESERTYELILAVAKEGEKQVKKGAISVKSNVPASFYIDDQLVGDTPMYYADLSCGTHTIKFTKEGYGDCIETIKVEEDDVVQVKGMLEIEVKVKFTCNVPDADLFINGNKVGKASGVYGLKEGQYGIVATAPSCTQFSGNMTVNKETDSYAIYLIREETIMVNNVPFVMKRVDGGSFEMGGGDRFSNHDEIPTHTVQVKGFYMSETEVTQAMWKAVMGKNPSYFVGDNLPVECVSWDDCQRFVSALNKLTNKNFRLPTEAEWEYAARGGTTTSLYSGEEINVIGDNNSPNLDPLGWYCGNCGRNYTQSEGCDMEKGVDISNVPGMQYKDPKGGLHPVGKKQPNAYGLYDMLGNVAEWCADNYGPYTSATQSDPKGPRQGSRRVLRGGGFNYNAQSCRVSSRSYSTPEEKQPFIGF